MKLLLNIPENKSAFIMEMLKHFSYVQATQLSAEDAKLLTAKTKTKAVPKRSKELLKQDIQKAVTELNGVLAGRKKSRDLQELINEL